MNLLEARTQFVKLSGRYDLVTGAFVDNGADYFLKAGLKFLDRRVGFDKEVVTLTSSLAIGDYLMDLPYQRVVEKVWVVTSTSKTELEYKTPTELTTLYGTYADVTNGTSKYFSMVLDTDQLSIPSIVVMPPTDSAVTLEVWVQRNTPWPSSDTATNFWFDNHEDIAVTAALYKLESSYRNTAGQNDLLATIELDLLGIEKDNIEDDAKRAGEMEG